MTFNSFTDELSQNFSELETLIIQKPYVDISVLLINKDETRLLFETKTEDALRKFFLFEYSKKIESNPIFYSEHKIYDKALSNTVNQIVTNAAAFYKHYYLFISPNKIFENFYDIEALFKKVDVSEYYLTQRQVHNHCIYIIGLGLFFKRYFYYNRYSDFGDDNYVYEIIPDQRYTMMYNKPIYRFDVNPRGSIDGSLHKNGEIIKLSNNELDLQSTFFDNKTVCLNLNSLNQSEYSKPGKDLVYLPHTLQNSFILTNQLPTTNDFSI